MCYAFRHLRELVACRMPNSRTFENKCGGSGDAESENRRIRTEKLEAPPGFEPGMEVLQISRGSLS
jgi:hypothetical protein